MSERKHKKESKFKFSPKKLGKNYLVACSVQTGKEDPNRKEGVALAVLLEYDNVYVKFADIDDPSQSNHRYWTDTFLLVPFDASPSVVPNRKLPPARIGDSVLALWPNDEDATFTTVYYTAKIAQVHSNQQISLQFTDWPKPIRLPSLTTVIEGVNVPTVVRELCAVNTKPHLKLMAKLKRSENGNGTNSIGNSLSSSTSNSPQKTPSSMPPPHNIARDNNDGDVEIYKPSPVKSPKRDRSRHSRRQNRQIMSSASVSAEASASVSTSPPIPTIVATPSHKRDHKKKSKKRKRDRENSITTEDGQHRSKKSRKQSPPLPNHVSTPSHVTPKPNIPKSTPNIAIDTPVSVKSTSQHKPMKLRLFSGRKRDNGTRKIDTATAQTTPIPSQQVATASVIPHQRSPAILPKSQPTRKRTLQEMQSMTIPTPPPVTTRQISAEFATTPSQLSQSVSDTPKLTRRSAATGDNVSVGVIHQQPSPLAPQPPPMKRQRTRRKRQSLKKADPSPTQSQTSLTPVPAATPTLLPTQVALPNISGGGAIPTHINGIAAKTPKLRLKRGANNAVSSVPTTPATMTTPSTPATVATTIQSRPSMINSLSSKLRRGKKKPMWGDYEVSLPRVGSQINFTQSIFGGNNSLLSVIGNLSLGGGTASTGDDNGFVSSLGVYHRWTESKNLSDSITVGSYVAQ